MRWRTQALLQRFVRVELALYLDTAFDQCLRPLLEESFGDLLSMQSCDISDVAESIFLLFLGESEVVDQHVLEGHTFHSDWRKCPVQAHALLLADSLHGLFLSLAKGSVAVMENTNDSEAIDPKLGNDSLQLFQSQHIPILGDKVLYLDHEQTQFLH